jgi:YfiH family protein
MSATVISKSLSKVSGILYGFGTKETPIPLPQHWDRKPTWKQVHGNSFAWVTKVNQACGDVDALITEQIGIPIAAISADCVPILFSHKEGSCIASLHAGWRGTLAKLPEALAQELKAKGQNLRDWVAAIGPAIRPCCYEVSEELSNQFRETFGGHATPNPTLPRMLDLQAVNEGELKRLGFGEVEVLKYCTRCGQDPAFNSYRREGSGTRQFSVIERSENRMTPNGLT